METETALQVRTDSILHVKKNKVTRDCHVLRMSLNIELFAIYKYWDYFMFMSWITYLGL